ncbi:NACHT, LRR and PYD domains-containing protein 1b allele 3-like isoform X1 [Trachinotus anak]|uniref:NACHT, LRR and PYD domains-containing protein 1b allele 3-like isoform X1 n=1 Tax=Trachinotus anak TaxID=443729 RepID=UPI0039F230E3
MTVTLGWFLLLPHILLLILCLGQFQGFSPELLTESGNTSYRFRCPGPGGFQCTLTGLVFVMDQGAELLYRTVQWDESLLQSAGKTPAGPLFDIQCPEDAVCELHLPHCETKDALVCEDLLSVVHIAHDATSFLKPLKITDTHVIVRVPHLSLFGLVWGKTREMLGRIWNHWKQIRSQVLLFLRPLNPKTLRQNLNVLLLPSNVPLEEVKSKTRDSVYIETPSCCDLIKDQRYSVSCPEAYKVQPQNKEFHLDFGPNYHPTFEIRLPTSTEEATITVQDQRRGKVWEHVIDLTDSVQSKENLLEPQSLSPEKMLDSVRPQFVESVSEPVLNQLLDKLLQQGVINDEEMESVCEGTRSHRARHVIDMVRKKGRQASSSLIDHIWELDPGLSRTLHLRSRLTS